ncbi:MAG: hypothetical protein E3J41_05220 [Candidatus Cloacimonadota bacterium]|nr:MAG: hypothetical protein E3J41_05220 [Candidatus Cloacimonadota bacterium]
MGRRHIREYEVGAEQSLLIGMRNAICFLPSSINTVAQTHIVLFFSALIPSDKISLGSGILKIESMMVCISNIAGIRIERNWL